MHGTKKSKTFYSPYLRAEAYHCYLCDIDRPATEFYKHKKGYLISGCRKCRYALKLSQRPWLRIGDNRRAAVNKANRAWHREKRSSLQYRKREAARYKIGRATLGGVVRTLRSRLKRKCIEFTPKAFDNWLLRNEVLALYGAGQRYMGVVPKPKYILRYIHGLPMRIRMYHLGSLSDVIKLQGLRSAKKRKGVPQRHNGNQVLPQRDGSGRWL